MGSVEERTRDQRVSTFGSVDFSSMPSRASASNKKAAGRYGPPENSLSGGTVMGMSFD
jgi:hypothetical protein